KRHRGSHTREHVRRRVPWPWQWRRLLGGDPSPFRAKWDSSQGEVDPAYIFAASVVGICLALLALVIWQASRRVPRPATPFSDDRSWWWDGRQWQPSVSKDGLWAWDGYRWIANRKAEAPP